MAVTVAGFVESVRTDTSDPMTWSHNTGTSGPKGVLVAIMHGTSSTDHVVSVTYGSKSLTRIQRNVDTATEPGAAEWWFAGEGIPTGTQTVTADLSSGTTDDIHGVSITLDASTDLSILDKGGIDENATNPSDALLNTSGSSTMSFAAMYSGLSTIASLAAGTDCTLFTTSELTGNFCSACVRQTTASTTNFTIAVTSAADDVAFATVMVQENPAPPVPTNYASRMGTMAAIWGAVVVSPLLASVVLINGTPGDVPPLPPRNDKPQAVVHESWRPPDWPTQFTRKVATSGPAVAIPQVPFSRASSIPIPQWPHPDWPTQTSKKTYIPDAKAPWSRLPSTPISLWPQDEWPAQSTRKVSATGPELFPMPRTDWGQAIIRQWPQPEWATQVTRKATVTGPEVYPVSRTEWGQRVIQTWPQPAWDTQVTRKAPIPDFVVVPDNPPPYRNFGAIYSRWDNTVISPLWGTAGYQTGPTVGGSADNPPPKRPMPSGLLSSWEPRPLQAVWFSRLVSDATQPFRRDVLPIILDSWQEKDWPSQRARKITASGPAVAQSQPFNRPAFQAIAVWTQVDWPTQQTKKITASGPAITTQPAFTRQTSQPISQWDEAQWSTQTRHNVSRITSKWWLFRNHTNTLGVGFQRGANQ